MSETRFVSHKLRTRTVLWMIVFLGLSFSIFRYLPGLQITTDAWVAVMALVLPVLIAHKLRNPHRRFTSVERYSLVILIVIPLISAFTSWRMFGQPMVYGLLSQRGLLLLGCAFLMSYYLRCGRVRVDELESAFKVLAWTNLALCAPVIFLLDPNKFSDLPNLVTDGGGQYNQFILPLTFIVFGFLYYAVSGIRHRSKRMSMLSLPFLIYIVVGVSGRTLTISVLATYLVFSVIWAPRSNLMTNLIKGAVFVAAFVAVIQLAAPDKIPELLSKYSDAFKAVLLGLEGSDPSANARLFQTAIAEPLILDNPLLGTGVISNQWNDGYKNLFGYFHPSDIGLLGVVFVYGVLGAVLFAYQFVLAWTSTRHLGPSHPKVNNLHYAIAAYLLYFFLSSITTGAYVFWLEHSMLLLAILQYGRPQNAIQRQHRRRLPAGPSLTSARLAAACQGDQLKLIAAVTEKRPDTHRPSGRGLASYDKP